MAKKEAPAFQEIMENKWLVEFKRKGIDKHGLFGFIVDYNEDFTLLNVFDNGGFFLNGYSVIRDVDISTYRIYDDDKYFLTRILKVKGVVPKPAENVSLESWEDILVTANEQFPLITIHREETAKNICHIGTVEETANKKFSLFEIDSDGLWEKTYKYKYSELTRVDFGGLYEEGLHLVSEYDKAETRTNTPAESPEDEGESSGEYL
jgi:hypothetical protein